MTEQHQQHGVGGVDLPNFWKRVRDQSHPAERVWYPLGEQELLSLLAEIARLRARCASLEAVVDAARGIALRQSPAHQALRQALAAHATTTQEGTH
jgi:hypothetical protein